MGYTLNKDIRQNLMNNCMRSIDSAYSSGWSDGYNKAKEDFGNAGKGIAKCERATPEQREKHGHELWGWCTECSKPIEGRWVGMANFCPWCGRIIEWKKDEVEQ